MKNIIGSLKALGNEKIKARKPVDHVTLAIRLLENEDEYESMVDLYEEHQIGDTPLEAYVLIQLRDMSDI